MLRFIASFFIILLLSAPVHAQEQTVFKVSLQGNYTPRYQLNYDSYNGAKSVSFRLSVYNAEAFPVEAGIYISTAYDPYASFSYGLSLAYIYTVNKNLLFKLGFKGGRIKMDRARSNLEVGGIDAADTHKSLQPYIELEWLFSDYLSLYLQSGYRLLQSETARVTKILKRTDYGYPIAYKTTTPIGWYGSCFQFSVGLSFAITSE